MSGSGSASAAPLFPAAAVRVGIAPIGWTNDDWPELGGDIPLARCLDEMAQAGYEGCEVGGKFPRDPERLRALLAPRRLQVASGWQSLHFTLPERAAETEREFRAHAEFLAAMGAREVVVCECGGSVQQRPLPLFAARPRFAEQEWRRLVAGLHRIGEVARGLALAVVYHHHVGTGVQSAEEVERLMSDTDPELVSLLVDSGHATYAGHDPEALLRRHAARVRYLHLKDVRAEIMARAVAEDWSFERAVRAGVFTVPGDGAVDMERFLGAAAASGYRGWMVVEAEQDPRSAPPLEYAQRGREFVRRVAGV